jgi:hypothetical protein
MEKPGGAMPAFSADSAHTDFCAMFSGFDGAAHASM